MTPVETVLRLCQSMEPDPWYPRKYFSKNQDGRETVEATLDQLRLGGFIELTPWTAEYGQGYRLTPEGRVLLANSRAIVRYNRGELPPPKVVPTQAPTERRANGDRWLQIRDALTSQEPATVSMILGGVCAAVFFWGYMLASRADAGQAFLMGFLGGDPRKFTPILNETGAVAVPYLLVGQWWRMLTANFVHSGVLHIGMNCYCLFILGPMTERRFGHWRFLIVCLVAALGSSALGVYFQGACVGFSGVVCGLLGATWGWNLVNRNILPRDFLARQRAWMIQNVVLLAIISVAPGVSWSGHLGGLVFGFLAGVLLTISRYGPVPIRVPSVVAAMMIGAFCVLGFKPVAEATGKWKQWRKEYSMLVGEEARSAPQPPRRG
jgi:membrane associated rhomboid family serine protease